MKKTCAILLIIILMVPSISFGLAESSDTSSFKDLEKDAWYYEDVLKMIEYQIINGYGDNTFRPKKFVKRNEYAKMLVKSLKIPTSDDTTSSFLDLKDSDWETKYVESAKYYLTGYKTSEGNLFKPDDDTLREDIMVALVKGLSYDYENVDTSILDDYADHNKISTNLRPYVAVAIKKGIVNGYEVDNKKYIKPLQPITRAETATLLMKVIKEEKITFDDMEKITFDDTQTTTSSVRITSIKKDGKLKLMWEPIDSTDIKGYKVMISKNNKKPTYPEDGYYRFIQNENSVEIRPNTSYTGGDLSTIKANEYYYFNVNTLYKDGSVKLSNTLKLKMPEADTTTPIDKDITLKGSVSENSFNLSWDQYTGSDFKGYKVVASTSDSTPTYPENGYFKYITNASANSISIPLNAHYNGGDVYQFKSNQKYHFAITVLTHSGKIYSNTIDMKNTSDTTSTEVKDISLRGNTSNNLFNLSWDQYTGSDFKGYKVVASTSDATPTYPENGYYKYITNPTTTSIGIPLHAYYNRGDFSKFKDNQKYHFSITVLTANNKVYSNTVKMTLEGEDTSADPQDISLTGNASNSSFNLSWDQYTGSDFKGYKVVASTSDATPTYPENGYYKYITNANANSITIPVNGYYKNGDFTKFNANQKYHFSITVLTHSGKTYSNTIQLEQ